MIAFVGDIHGDIPILRKLVDGIAGQFPEVTAVIQVGDFGWYKSKIRNIQLHEFKLPVYFIDGNHEEFPLLRGIETVTEMSQNVFFVPRGTVMELDGRRIAFIGGAASVDKDIRVAMGADWYPDENITDEQLARLNGAKNIDILVTHVPPQSVIQRHFDPRNLLYFGLPTSWKDQNADKIEWLWAELGYPQVFCGHMHRPVVEEKCRILDINEFFCF